MQRESYYNMKDITLWNIMLKGDTKPLEVLYKRHYELLLNFGLKYVSDEEAAKISRNPDWQCSFCGSLNSDNLDSCKNCGATKEESERNYFEMRQQEEEKKRKKEEQKASSQRAIQKNQENLF